MKKNIFILTMAFIIAHSLGCSADKKKGIQIKSEPPVPVKIFKVVKKLVNNKVSLIGQLEGEIEIDILPDITVSGIVKNIKVIEGSKVRKGAPLMEIDQQAVTGRIYRRFLAKAKISGFVSRVYVKEGGQVSPQTPLCRIIQMDRVKVIIDIPEKDITKVRKGQDIEVHLESYPDSVVMGKINRLYPALDPATLTLRTEVILNNPDYKLKSGMFATVDILLDKKEKILVPMNSVIMEDNISYVFGYNKKNNTVKRKIIVTGQNYNRDIEVVSGLVKDEPIVVKGNYQVSDGEKVDVLNKEDI